jgi:cytohesin
MRAPTGLLLRAGAVCLAVAVAVAVAAPPDVGSPDRPAQRKADRSERMQAWLDNELWWVLGWGTLEEMAQSLREGANPNDRNSSGQTPLHRVAGWAYRPERVELLLRYGADVNAVDAGGMTPTGEAAAGGTEEKLALLLDAGGRIGEPVLDLAVRGDVVGLRRLLAAYPDAAHLTHEELGSPARLAARFGHTGALRALVEAGADTQERSDLGHTLLDYAAGSGNPATVRYLLGLGLDVNVRAPDDWLPLHSAISRRNAAAVGLLLDAGANVFMESNGRDALVQAVSWSSPEVVRLVLRAMERQRGVRAKSATRALCEAASRGRLPVVRLLVRAGADPGGRCPKGSRPLLAAAREGQWEVVRYLLRQGVDPDTWEAWTWEKGWNRATALFWALEQGDAAAVRMLLRAGASAAGHEEARATPLHVAAESGRADLVALLLSEGAGPNGRREPDPGRLSAGTPLLAAAQGGHVAVGEILLDAGARIDARNYAGESAFHLALMAGHRDFAAMLLERGGPVRHRAHAMAAAGMTDGLAALLDEDADVLAAVDSVGWSALHWAAAFDRPECVRLLVARGALVNDLVVRRRNDRVFFDPARSQRPRDRLGITPLFLAAINGSCAAVEELLQAGAQPALASYRVGTPLHAAALRGHADCVRALIAHGADVEAEAQLGDRTPLQLAAREGRRDAVLALIDGGAAPDVGDHWNDTPRYLARKNGYPALARLLRERSKPR